MSALIQVELPKSDNPEVLRKCVEKHMAELDAITDYDRARQFRDAYKALENRHAIAAGLRLHAEARMGEILASVPKLTPEAAGSRKGSQRVETLPSNAQLGVHPEERKRYEGLAKAKASGDLAVYVETTIASGERPSTNGALRHAAGVHVGQNSGNNEWYTPPEILDAARLVLDKFDLDPASSRAANTRVKATRFYTAEDDGLSKPWRGRVWLNPPYAQPLITDFCERLVSEYEAGRVKAAIALVNNGTETAWGQRLLASAAAVCFPSGRVRFIDPDGKPSGAPLQGQMVVYLGDDKPGFKRAFKAIGVVR